MTNELDLRDQVAIAILTGLFARESLTSLNMGDKVRLADFAYGMADIGIERRNIKKYENAEEALKSGL